MDRTLLLPPISAVRLAWAQTGAFAKDVKSSNDIATSAKTELESIANKGAASNDAAERLYVFEAMHAIASSMRILDILYKERDLNFKQTQDLRAVLFDRAKDYKEFGGKLGDFIKAIPSLPVAVTGGTVATLSAVDRLQGWPLAIASAAAAIGGIAIHIWWIQHCGDVTMANYMRLDYERGLYYTQYLARVRQVLRSLYLRIDELHCKYFTQIYPETSSADVQTAIEASLQGVDPLMCEYVHQHMAENKVSPTIWAACESDVDKVLKCCRHHPLCPPRWPARFWKKICEAL